MGVPDRGAGGHGGLCQGYLGVIRPDLRAKPQRMLWSEPGQAPGTVDAGSGGATIETASGCPAPPKWDRAGVGGPEQRSTAGLRSRRL